MKRFALALAGAWVGMKAAARLAYSYRGKVVLITGGSRGLGLVLARKLAARGARLALAARDADELARAQQELGGSEVLGIACDVTDEKQAAAAVEATVRRFGHLDVLINCAGIISVAPASSMGLADFRAAMETNYFGVVHATLAALPFMRRRRTGRIVNICSIGGAVPIPHLLPYTASKFAATGFSEGLRAEVGRDGIRVITVLPGVMRTGSFVQALFKGQREREAAWFSLGASLPGSSVSAARAAAQILDACALGRPYLVIGLPAKLLRLAHALLPGTTGAALAVAERLLLPGPGGAGPDEAAEPGYLHRPAPSVLTRLGDEAARRNGELPWAPA